MFNQLDIKSPFYTHNSFDFESESSDSDFEEMSVINQIHTAGSNIHKGLVEFFQQNPIPAGTYTDNQTVLKALYEADENLWKAYGDAVTAYSNEKTTDQRLADANVISAAAIAIRSANANTKLTIISTGQAAVTLTGLTAAEIASLNALHQVVVTKMTGSAGTGNAEKAAKMVEDFKSDMEKAKIDNCFPERWANRHGVWKCVQHELQKGRALDYDENDPTARDKEAWKNVVKRFKECKMDAIIQPNETLANASNKFAVDVYCAAINRYRMTTQEDKRSFDDFKTILEIVAAWLGKTSIKKSEWQNLVRVNKKYKQFLDRLDEANTLYDNPGKLTRARLFACASSVFAAPEPLAMFGVSSRLEKIPKMIVKIYDIEVTAGLIDVRRGTTSTSEHLLHLLLTLSSANAYVWNRNSIPTSIRQTTFHLN